MSIIKRYDLRGLNLRQSNINRDPNYASDVLNVQLNGSKEIVKRFGYDSVNVSSGVELTEYFRGSELIRQKSAGLSKLVGAAWVDINRNTGSIIKLLNTNASYAEYNGVLYFADPSGDRDLYKYDGYTYYRAGVPTPKVTTATGAGAFFYRCVLKYRDPQGNITYGDYVQFDNLADSAVFQFSQMQDEFYEKYAEKLGVQQIGPSFGDTITVKLGHNYNVNDYIMFGDPSLSSNTDTARIIFVDASNIVVDTSTMEFNYTLADSRSIEKRTECIVFKSTDATFGYESTFSNIEAYWMNREIGPISITAHTGTSDTRFMEDEYDTTILKGLPPRCKYITFSNNVMVLGNNTDTSFVNFKTSLTDIESSFYWSDLGVGSTVETFPPFNVDTAGRSSEGEITGVFGASDNVIILKERQVYYVNGNLVLGSYRVRSALTNEVGCVSHRSIIGVLGGCLFMSSRGLYHARFGQVPTEISDIIEPLFRDSSDLNLELSKTINDSKNEKLYINIPYIGTPNESLTVVYDYLFKEWFLFKGINAGNGFSMLIDDMYHSDNTNLYKRSSSYNDDGSSIPAYYKGSWEDQGFPTVTKKFKKLSLITADTLTWDANIKSQNDWNKVDDITDETLNMVGPMVDDISLDMTQRKSMRISIENDVLDQGMLVTGYEIEVESTQLRSKGES